MSLARRVPTVRSMEWCIPCMFGGALPTRAGMCFVVAYSFLRS